MKNFYVPPQFEVVRDPQRCVNCKVCVEQCPNGVHRFDETHGRMLADESSAWTASGAWRTVPPTL